MNEVATDVQERAPTKRQLVGDAGRVGVKVAKEPNDRAKSSDSAFFEQGPYSQPLVISADHEGFANLDSSAFADRQQIPGFRSRNPNWLFSQHLLTALGRL